MILTDAMLKSLRGTKSQTAQALTAPPDPTYRIMWPQKILQFFSFNRLMPESPNGNE